MLSCLRLPCHAGRVARSMSVQASERPACAWRDGAPRCRSLFSRGRRRFSGSRGRTSIATISAQRVSVADGDIDDTSDEELRALGIAADTFDHVLANPPFHVEGDGTAAFDKLKAAAHAMPVAGLERWSRFLARMARPGGMATIIHKAEALADLLEGLGRRFGGLKVLPVHARADEPAIRVIVQGVKGSKAPLLLLPQFVLHERERRLQPQSGSHSEAWRRSFELAG